MFNRETGAMPVLSRSCMVELALYRHWVTGKTKPAVKPSQKNCLIYYAVTFCERQKGICWISTSFCYEQRAFLF